ITKLRLLSLAASALLMSAVTAAPSAAQEAAKAVPNPNRQDQFQLNDLASYKKFSQVKNFTIVGHSFFRGPWVVPCVPGSGFHTMRICGNIAYMAGYNPTLYGVLIADVSNPAKMQVLSFIPANPGNRSAYLRVDCGRKILAIAHSTWPENPNRPAA